MLAEKAEWTSKHFSHESRILAALGLVGEDFAIEIL
jgi:hypothetical protein